jgi:CBS domain-containing protein
MWATTNDLRLATRRASLAGQGVAWLLMAAGFLMVLGLRVPILGTGFANGLWIAFIGWFLNNAALMSYRELFIRESLQDVPVARLMQTRFTRVAPQMRVSALVDDHLMPGGQRAFPVEDDGRFVGMVCLRDLHNCSRDAWNITTVGDIMTPVERLATVSPRQDGFQALAMLARRDLNQLPVVDAGRLVGFIRREDILKWLSLHAQPGSTGSGDLESPVAPD